MLTDNQWARIEPLMLLSGGRDGTWDAILTRLLRDADATGLIEWEVSVDST